MSLNERRGWIADHLEFLEFLEGRPDEERWELVDGVPVMMNPPLSRHTHVKHDAVRLLDEPAAKHGWLVFSDLAVRSDRESSQVAIPDVLVSANIAADCWWTEAPIVVVEILSPSTRRADLGWKKRFYTSFPSLEHYLVLDPNIVAGRLYSRAMKFASENLAEAGAEVALTALGTTIPLARFYHRAGLAG
jgi:Uma2 family endonuclease